MDFLAPSIRTTKSGREIYPEYLAVTSEDLMIKGGDFFAIWDEEAGLWTKKQERAVQLIDAELRRFASSYPDANVRYLKTTSNKEIDRWRHYVKNQMWDTYRDLDSVVNFADTPPDKYLYASRRLPYRLEDMPTPAYDELMNVLYDPDERMKIEWAVGSIFAGDSVKLHKFLVLYGDKGTGKSTVLNIIIRLFTTGKDSNNNPEGYFGEFDAKSLGAAKDFALESLKDNPLIGIQQDGDLSRIEDNTIINSLVSHEMMPVNTKHKSIYTSRFHTFLFMGTNRPVRITDSRSGILRRLIDVSPTGNTVSVLKYWQLRNAIKFELGGIAKRCLDIYNNNKNLYDNYIPTKMMGASNSFYNYIQEFYDIFMDDQQITLKAAYTFYTKYCSEAGVPERKRMSRMAFKEELKNYFLDFKERTTLPDGTRVRNLYSGFKHDAFEVTQQKTIKPDSKFIFKEQASLLDDILKDMPAQYANNDGKPTMAWDNVETKLSDISTRELHYVRMPENHIVIDLDIKDETGNKSFAKNLEMANKFPVTYAELSKSGAGIHLHYIYTGDTSQLSCIYDEDVEVKVFNGKSSLRRKLTKCNDIPIATISSGLPLKKPKKGEKMLNKEAFQSGQHLENSIRWVMEQHKLYKSGQPTTFRPFGQEPATANCCRYIKEKLDEAYNSGLQYDISPLREQVMRFASNSSHQANECIKLMMDAHWRSEDISEPAPADEDKPIAFYDVEVFPNLLIICWSLIDSDTVHAEINPSADWVQQFVMKHRLIGFNNRRYDNHILWARMLGYTNMQIYDISKRIVSGDRNAFFREAYNISYTDIFDFMAVKKSLKALEIEMRMNHVELGLDWNEPVPEELWDRVAGYCVNDVNATKAAFEYLKSDWEGRKILAKLAGGNVNQSTNSLSTLFIFGKDRAPQSQFNYRDLSKPVDTIDNETWGFLTSAKPYMHKMTDECGEESWLPYFDGYKFEAGKSTYKGEEVGEGGYVYSEPGIYSDVALLDIASMHPNSIISECLFGVEYTQRFKDILDARVMVKHGELDALEKHMGGAFKEVVDDIRSGAVDASALAYALKIVINSIYGLTKASFDNPFKDPRNIDNIVAKRGALFMIDLKEEVQKRGFTVAHIKTDSIKIPNATPEIIQFVMDFGKKYGYEFEHEATYKKMCLVNKAVYIAQYEDGTWTATGKQFQIPYVFKTLFDKSKPIDIFDMGETKSSKTALYLDFDEDLPEGEHNYQFIGRVGQFTPVKEGYGGGRLLVSAVSSDGNKKYDYAQEAKGYRWKETMSIDNLEEIDRSFYINKVDEAIDTINEFGNFAEFMEGE